MPRDLSTIFVEGDVIGVGFGAGRLVAGRPNVTTANIPEENIGAPVIAGGILAPTRDGQPTPATVTGAGGRQHDRIATVGQQMRGNRSGVSSGQSPPTLRADLPHDGFRL